ncbi:MAG TPA: acylphosphatase [Dehalococcoidia bacterium]|nr:acylphosphatase [Dehalococcoidia bacterium]
MPESDAAIRAVVRGRVQGVGFRDFVEARARALGLAGFVRNMNDHRSVEVVAEGAREKLERLIDALYRGPGMSRVDAVEVAWGEATGEYVVFATRY